MGVVNAMVESVVRRYHLEKGEARERVRSLIREQELPVDEVASKIRAILAGTFVNVTQGGVTVEIPTKRGEMV